MRISITLVCALLLAACGSRERSHLPEISTACVAVENAGKGPEADYIKRRTRQWLIDEGGFSGNDQRCEAIATFTALDSANWEVLTGSLLFGKTASTVWRAEGLLTIIEKDGTRRVEDDPIAVSGHTTKQAMLEDISWQIAKRVIARYRAAPKH